MYLFVLFLKIIADMQLLTRKDGMRLFPNALSIAPNQGDDYFVDPFSFRKLRYRCLFIKIKDLSERLLVYFHLHETEPFITSLPASNSINFHVAFNEITVWQIKSLGNIREMTKDEQRMFIELITKRFNNKDVGDKLPIMPSEDEKAESLLLIQTGKFYRFEPLTYKYHIYERG